MIEYSINFFVLSSGANLSRHAERTFGHARVYEYAP
jgi:hypothetical protein